jgi:hypothetical protein
VVLVVLATGVEEEAAGVEVDAGVALTDEQAAMAAVKTSNPTC